jgi:hypothetical protein
MGSDGDVPGITLGPRFDCRDTGSLVPIYGKDVIKAQMPDAVAELLGIPRGLILDRFRAKFNEFVDRTWPFYEHGPLRQMVERRDFVTSVPAGVRLKFERGLLFLDIFRAFNAWVVLEDIGKTVKPGERCSVKSLKRRRGRPTNAEVRARQEAESAAASASL